MKGMYIEIESNTESISVIAQEKLGTDSVVVTVFSDDNKKYLSTDLLRKEPVKREFISKDIELKYFESHKRVCMTCCEPDYCIECLTPDYEYDLPACIRR